MALALGTNSGFVTVRPTADPNGTGTTIDGSSVVTKHTTPADAVRLTEVGWYRASGTNTANWEIALYSDLAGIPVTRLFVDATNSTSSSGWVTTAVNWAVSPSTAYWLALQMDAHTGSSQVDAAASGGAGSDVLASQTTLNDPYGGGVLADADGMYAIYGLVELPITGSGSPDAQSSTVAGAGVSGSTGTGALSAQSSAVDGEGAAGDPEITGTGAPASQASAASGDGITESAGQGAPAAQSSQAGGVGISLSAGLLTDVLSGLGALAGSGAVSGEGAVGEGYTPPYVGSGSVQRGWRSRSRAYIGRSSPTDAAVAAMAANAVIHGSGAVSENSRTRIRRMFRL